MTKNTVNEKERMVVTRVFDAPRALVWKAWTDPKYVMQWWGPKGFTAPFCKIDFRVGGKFLCCMRAPDGQEGWNGGEYHEIVLHEKIVYSLYFADSKGNKVEPAQYGIEHEAIDDARDVVIFEDFGNGQTKLTMIGNETMEAAKNSGQLEGWNQILEKVAAVIAGLALGGRNKRFKIAVVSAPDIDELFAQTLSGDYEDESPWEAVRALRHLGTREVFEKAAEWCESDDPLARARGADVLAQLGKTIEHKSNSFPEESYFAVAALAQQETHPMPLSSAIAALGHLDDPLGVPLIVQFYTHPSSEVRFAVACALGAFPNEPRSAAALLKLMRDTDEDIRDWATFGLGVQGETDSPEMRDALVLCLGDSNEDVREEAMVGLAKRKDRRVLEVLLAALEQQTVTDRVIEAACMMLDLQNEREGWKATNYAAALRKQFSL